MDVTAQLEEGIHTGCRVEPAPKFSHGAQPANVNEYILDLWE